MEHCSACAAVGHGVLAHHAADVIVQFCLSWYTHGSISKPFLLVPAVAAAAGLVTHDDMQIMLRQLAGSSLSDDDIAWLVRKALQEADSPQGLSLEAFKATLHPQDLAGMTVQVPTEL
jgi:hypothetical protein